MIALVAFRAVRSMGTGAVHPEERTGSADAGRPVGRGRRAARARGAAPLRRCARLRRGSVVSQQRERARRAADGQHDQCQRQG